MEVSKKRLPTQQHNEMQRAENAFDNYGKICVPSFIRKLSRSHLGEDQSQSHRGDPERGSGEHVRKAEIWL
ncbi:MAG: hypothetical protein QXU09_03910 [Thermoproteota archaeon]